ncbi:MAG: hypothetical protein M5U28_27170 [Sandaracinaceae bacterium]|nr:hypothetical protein [Sandaracinaceae bacterium]
MRDAHPSMRRAPSIASTAASGSRTVTLRVRAGLSVVSSVMVCVLRCITLRRLCGDGTTANYRARVLLGVERVADQTADHAGRRGEPRGRLCGDSGGAQARPLALDGGGDPALEGVGQPDGGRLTVVATGHEAPVARGSRR